MDIGIAIGFRFARRPLVPDERQMTEQLQPKRDVKKSKTRGKHTRFVYF